MKIRIKNPIVFMLLGSFLITASPVIAQEVKNTDKPKKGSWDFGMVKEWDVEEVNGDVFAQIGFITTDQTGKVFLVDRKLTKIFILDSNGKYISSFGRQGEGPGEIKQIGACYLTGQKLLFPDNARMHYFSLDGKYLKTVIYPNSVRPRDMIDENLIISVPRINWDDPKGKAKFSIYDLQNKKERILFKFNTYEKGVVRKSSGKSNSTFSFSSSTLTPMMTLDYQPATKRLYYGKTDNYRITVRDLSDVPKGGTGKEVLVFSLDREKQKVPKGHKDELLEGINWPDNIKQQIKNGFPDYLTDFTRIIGDKRGYVYVYRNHPDIENKLELDIFSPEGVYIYESAIAVPEDLSIDRIHWNGNHLYLVTENEDGELKLTKYKIKLPE